MADLIRAPRLNSAGAERMYQPGKLSLGLFVPIEAYAGDMPSMENHEAMALLAEELGYAALWVRDVPMRDPSFGDVGQIFDPWVYLGWLAARTRKIALATGSIILPLRHPIHTAKAAASVDHLTGSRLVLGVASGDRPVEFPAFGVDHAERGALFQDHLAAMRQALEESRPVIRSASGTTNGIADTLPKAVGTLPMMITGHSQQSLEWIAEHADGWISYPRPAQHQQGFITRWREAVETVAPGTFKPFTQSLYVDLSEDQNEDPRPIHLGFRAGATFLKEFLEALEYVGVNHVILNVKYGQRPAKEVIQEIGEAVMPRFAKK
jgi:luciferase-type oxidoreductase